MDRLMELAERVEAASGPSREIDEAIERALPPAGPRCELPSLWNERAAQFHGARIGEYDADDYVPTAYTRSLDAAMTLAPECRAADLLDQALNRAHRIIQSDVEFRRRLPAFLTAACLRARARSER